jgi:hypothetical protein
MRRRRTRRTSPHGRGAAPADMGAAGPGTDHRTALFMGGDGDRTSPDRGPHTRARDPTYARAYVGSGNDALGGARVQAVWLRRRRSSINEPIASPPSATTGMTKRALRIVPPHCRSDGKSTAAGNLNHLSRPDGSCLAGWRAARNSRWNCLVTEASTAHSGWGPDMNLHTQLRARRVVALRRSVGLVKTSSGRSLLAVCSSRRSSRRAGAGTRRAPR